MAQRSASAEKLADRGEEVSSPPRKVYPHSHADLESLAETSEPAPRSGNAMFGFAPWIAAHGHQDQGLRNRGTSVYVSSKAPADAQMPEAPRKTPAFEKPTFAQQHFITPGNLVYFLLCGWWTALLYLIAGILLYAMILPRAYGKLCLSLAGYCFWPFGKYLELHAPGSSPLAEDEARGLLGSNNIGSPSAPTSRTARREKGAVGLVSAALFYVFAMPLLAASHIAAWCICWFFVVLIPMSKVHAETVRLLFKAPLSVGVGSAFPPPPGSNIALLAYSAVNFNYLNYTVDGMNVVLVNLLPFVIVALLMAYVTSHEWKDEHYELLFVLTLISVVPLAYYIGSAVAAISAQTSFAVGAVLQAGFGSVIELLIYYFSVTKGLNDLVTAGITGSLLGAMLLVPGLSMVVGGARHKLQRFNTNAAGVSAVLLLIAVVGDFTPTMFYLFYGSYDLNCKPCTAEEAAKNPDQKCSQCTRFEDLTSDPMYTDHAKPLMYFCAIVLPIAYLIGLIFSLKTHAQFYQQTGEHKNTHEEEGEEGGEHESLSQWSLKKSLIVLVISTVLFAMIAEAMTDAIKPFLETIGMSQRFAGLTIIAIMPNIAEVVNAMIFAYNNNITLAMEIGSVSAIQVSLIQMPFLVMLSYVLFIDDASSAFALIFPPLDVFAVFVAVIILAYIVIDGRCNYFEGSALVLVYIVLIAAFYFQPNTSVKS